MATPITDTRVQRAALSRMFQEHMQKEMEKAAEGFWQEFDRRCRRAGPAHKPRKKKQSHPPAEGYVCNICGKEGGLPDSHWIQFCPERNKPKTYDTASSTAATIADSENDPQQPDSPRSLPDFTDQPPEEEEESKEPERPNSR